MSYKSFILLFFIIIIIGCDSNEINELKFNLKEAEGRLNKAYTEIELLNTQNQDLRKKYEQVVHDYENLQLKRTEINEWIEHMIKGYGPCVWAIGQFERPIPHEFVKKGTPVILIAKLNNIFRKLNSPEATLLKVEDGIAYVKIIEDEKLTQGMGTSGAANYINSIVYTLFSIADIKCVDLDFEEGDHAFPGRDCIGESSY